MHPPQRGCRQLPAQLLGDAPERDTPMGRLRVIRIEGLIAFKLQGFVNDPARTRDVDDVRALLRANAGSIDLDEVARYFRLFEREDLFDELVAQSKPARP
jgi:hypothetical protein